MSMARWDSIAPSQYFHIRIAHRRVFQRTSGHAFTIIVGKQFRIKTHRISPPSDISSTSFRGFKDTSATSGLAAADVFLESGIASHPSHRVMSISPTLCWRVQLMIAKSSSLTSREPAIGESFYST